MFFKFISKVLFLVVIYFLLSSLFIYNGLKEGYSKESFWIVSIITSFQISTFYLLMNYVDFCTKRNNK